MESGEIVRTLSRLDRLRVTASEDRVVVYVPAIDDSVHLFADEVGRARMIFAPTGDRAVELAVGDEHDQWPLILTGDDVVYAPMSPDVLLESPISIVITNAPLLVAYSEMERDAEGIALACERAGTDDLEGLPESLLLLRCFIAGAARFGLRPVRAVAWWQRGLQAVGADLPFPPFRPDAAWDELAEDAARVILVASPPGEADDTAAIIAGLTTADLEALQPAMTAVQLDEEFVESWKEWIPIAPATFARTLMKGMPGARSDVALYPDGAGTIDVRDLEGDAVRALLELRFSFPDGVMTIDEIRIRKQATGTGLFQRLIFNTERLSSLLGLRKVVLLATGVGRYALARVGVYPQDPELLRKITGQPLHPLDPELFPETAEPTVIQLPDVGGSGAG